MLYPAFRHPKPLSRQQSWLVHFTLPKAAVATGSNRFVKAWKFEDHLMGDFRPLKATAATLSWAVAFQMCTLSSTHPRCLGPPTALFKRWASPCKKPKSLAWKGKFRRSNVTLDGLSWWMKPPWACRRSWCCAAVPGKWPLQSQRHGLARMMHEHRKSSLPHQTHLWNNSNLRTALNKKNCLYIHGKSVEFRVWSPWKQWILYHLSHHGLPFHLQEALELHLQEGQLLRPHRGMPRLCHDRAILIHVAKRPGTICTALEMASQSNNVNKAGMFCSYAKKWLARSVSPVTCPISRFHPVTK